MREIRPSGSVRGVRRKPYPYRDEALNPMRKQRVLSLGRDEGRRTGHRRVHGPPRRCEAALENGFPLMAWFGLRTSLLVLSYVPFVNRERSHEPGPASRTDRED